MSLPPPCFLLAWPGGCTAAGRSPRRRLGLFLLLLFVLLFVGGLGLVVVALIGLLVVLGLRIALLRILVVLLAGRLRVLLAHLDKPLEAPEVGIETAARAPEQRTGSLQQALRLPIESHHHAREPVAQPMERDNGRGVIAAPGDALVCALVDDLTVGHDFRVLLEVREALIRRLERHYDIDGHLNRQASVEPGPFL